MTASRSDPRGLRRSRCDGPALLRIAGYGFVVAGLIQAATVVEQALGTSPADDAMAAFEEAHFLLVEPAAGPEPGQVSVDPVSDAEPSTLLEENRACDPQLLRAIDERHRQLDAWSSDLAARARMLEAIEARASEQVQALRAARASLETTLERVDHEAEAEIERLVKIYENMKPKEAARIFEAMPADVAAGFVRRMAEQKSALVMGNLDARHAYAITLAMANSHVPPAEP
jgi:flagellar motility protein MotE (MotC chaperone)